MVRIPLSTLLILSALLCLPVQGAQQIRPNAGIGLLIIRPFSPDRASETSRLTLYNYPGVTRIAELKNDVIPELHPVLDSAPGAYAVGVTEKKGNWLKIAYDDSRPRRMGQNGAMLGIHSMGKLSQGTFCGSFTKTSQIILPASKRSFGKLGTAYYLIITTEIAGRRD